MAKSALFRKGECDLTEDEMREAIEELERVLSNILSLLLMMQLADEWILLCTSMETIHRDLLHLLRACRSGNASELQEAQNNGRTTEWRNSDSVSSLLANIMRDRTAASATVKKSATKKNCEGKCGCALFSNFLICVFRLHKAQCDAASKMCNFDLESLKDKLPTLCHIRATYLIANHFPVFIHCTDDSKCACNKSPNVKIWVCSRLSSQLDDLITLLSDDMEGLLNGDKLLCMTISLLACLKRDKLVTPKSTLWKINQSTTFLSDLIRRTSAFGFKLIDKITPQAKFTYSKQHCECKHSDVDFKDCCNNNNCKGVRCPGC
ncbi:peptidase C15, putative [Babesia ovata]|uniref:Peptidase C15, putative n=1 Tax=Babesia ovata TaxID=189622 RepID=A0A2H6KEP2_9APIC|nr:peptidase C15, putative [Babesia ovata]GBE61463.1 peptidase C15, putative [Babesia ovata]